MKGPSLGNKLEGRNVVASLTYLSSLLCVIEEIIIDVLDGGGDRLEAPCAARALAK